MQKSIYSFFNYRDKKFFNCVNLMTINTLFDTITIRGIDIQERLLNQMHLDY